MGKSMAGAVWLNAERVSAYDFWQYWRNTEDDDVGRFLKLFTEMPLDEVARLEALKGQEINEAKKILATEITALAHGRKAAEDAAETARRTFEEGARADTLPTVSVPRARLAAGIAAFELLHEAGLAESRTEARKLIKGGGGRLNDKPIAGDTATVGEGDLDSSGTLKLSAGRKRHVLVQRGLIRAPAASPARAAAAAGGVRLRDEELAQGAGGHRRHHVDVGLEVVERAGELIGDGEQAAILAAGQQRAEQRHVRQQVVQRKGRHDDAGELGRVVAEIDIALRGEADRLAAGAAVPDVDAIADLGDLGLEVVELLQGVAGAVQPVDGRVQRADIGARRHPLQPEGPELQEAVERRAGDGIVVLAFDVRGSRLTIPSSQPASFSIWPKSAT